MFVFHKARDERRPGTPAEGAYLGSAENVASSRESRCRFVVCLLSRERLGTHADGVRRRGRQRMVSNSGCWGAVGEVAGSRTAGSSPLQWNRLPNPPLQTDGRVGRCAPSRARR